MRKTILKVSSVLLTAAVMVTVISGCASKVTAETSSTAASQIEAGNKETDRIETNSIETNSEEANSTEADTSGIAAINGDVQTVTTKLGSRYYPPITVQKGIPVKWIIQADANSITGCNNEIIISEYNIQKALEVGDNVIEFTPTESGTVPFSCWMGMLTSTITVVDGSNNIAQPDSDNTSQSPSPAPGGGCCSN